MREDHKLQAAVSERLDLDPSIDSSRIGVASKSGIVTLSGQVTSLIERTRAERVAGSVRGVKAIVNTVSVEPAGMTTPDERLAELAYARLASNISVPDNRLHVAVHDGAITLHGDVDWPFQLQAALNDLEHLPGARGLHNDVEIRPPVSSALLRQQIGQTMAHAPLDAQRILVETDGSRVILAGEVTSWHERSMAESAAWCVPGVSQVVNNIKVV